MVEPLQPLPLNKQFDATPGTPVIMADGIVRLTAPNSGPYTFTGTNTYLIGRERLLLVDPGPDSDDHLMAILAAVGGRPVEAILLTHTHRDHSALVPRLRRQIPAPLWFGGQHRLSRPLRPFERNPLAHDCDWSLVPDRVLADGEALTIDGAPLTVVSTPGHCRNHLAFALPRSEILLSGDHVMGWSSTLVAVPDGSMADYLASLDKLLGLAPARYLPGHGDAIADGRGFAAALLKHRELRNRQIVEAATAGVRTLPTLVSRLYPGLSLPLQRAARMTLIAHIEYLETRGELRVSRSPFGLRITSV